MITRTSSRTDSNAHLEPIEPIRKKKRVARSQESDRRVHFTPPNQPTSLYARPPVTDDEDAADPPHDADPTVLNQSTNELDNGVQAPV